VAPFAIDSAGPKAALLSALVLLATACFDDLPASRQCPGAERVQVDDCKLSDIKAEQLGCLSFEQIGCFARDRSSCDCGPEACPTSRDACYPDGDCPAAVTSAVGSEARCRRLEASQIGGGLPESLQCLCGCSSCISVCDGYGPLVGVVAKGLTLESFAIPLLDIRDQAPDAGRLGIYLRVRGLANVLVLAGKSETNSLSDFETVVDYRVTTPLSYDFVEHVLLDQVFLGNTAYSWTAKEQAPTTIAIGAGLSTEPTVTLFELDCVVPFYLPN